MTTVCKANYRKKIILTIARIVVVISNRIYQQFQFVYIEHFWKYTSHQSTFGMVSWVKKCQTIEIDMYTLHVKLGCVQNFFKCFWIFILRYKTFITNKISLFWMKQHLFLKKKNHKKYFQKNRRRNPVLSLNIFDAQSISNRILFGNN